MEADSELSCALGVLPANADEAANAKPLIASEECAQGNPVASRSMDRIGYRGDVLAEWSDPTEGPQVLGYVPPLDWMGPAPEGFHPEVVTLTERRDEVPCPGGAPTRRRSKREHGWRFHFRPTQWRVCPLRGQGLRLHARGGARSSRPPMKRSSARPSRGRRPWRIRRSAAHLRALSGNWPT